MCRTARRALWTLAAILGVISITSVAWDVLPDRADRIIVVAAGAAVVIAFHATMVQRRVERAYDRLLRARQPAERRRPEPTPAKGFPAVRPAARGRHAA